MIPDRWNRENFKSALREPSKFIQEMNDITPPVKYQPHERLDGLIFNKKYGDGIDAMKNDWDNLIILDACRYDIFEQQNYLEGKLSKVTSKASHSVEFIRENFNGRHLHDTVYVTANPKVNHHLEKDVFYKVVKVHSTTNYKEREFHPELVNQFALDEYENNENKRFIVHYMQPHAPYIGKKAQRIKKRLYENKNVGFIMDSVDEDFNTDPDKTLKNLIKAVKRGYVSDDELLEVYIENLDIVLNYVEDLLNKFEGKTVITADHGEQLGNPTHRFPIKEKYRHPMRTYTPELRVVPWFEIESDSRPEIVSEEPERTEDVTSDYTDKQLEALGYK